MPPKKVLDPSLRYNVVDRQFPHSPVTKVWHTDLKLADALRAKEQIAGSRRSKVVCIEPMDPQPNGVAPQSPPNSWSNLGWLPDRNDCGDDAGKWAAAFMKSHGHNLAAIDEGLMIGWFANAIESRPRPVAPGSPYITEPQPRPVAAALPVSPPQTFTLEQMQSAARAAAKSAADEANERHARLVQPGSSTPPVLPLDDLSLVFHYCVSPGYLGDHTKWCFWETDFPHEGAYGPYASAEEAVRAAATNASSGGFLHVIDHVYETEREARGALGVPVSPARTARQISEVRGDDLSATPPQ